MGVCAVAERETVCEARGEPETYYTPARVGWWLCHWRELLELAVPTAGAIRYDRPSICVPEGMKPRDAMHYTDVMLDIEGAFVQLRRWSLERQMAEWTMAGYEIETIADLMRVPREDAREAAEGVRHSIARILGWRAR